MCSFHRWKSGDSGLFKDTQLVSNRWVLKPPQVSPILEARTHWTLQTHGLFVCLMNGFESNFLAEDVFYQVNPSIHMFPTEVQGEAAMQSCFGSHLEMTRARTQE